jgi:pimeloyl-ACP methyl ester carboxylesterase
VPTVSVNDATIAYEVCGQGDPILFLHGIFVSQRQWQPQIAYFNPPYRVITCDLRGHGQSSTSSEPYSVTLFAGDVVALLDQLQIEQVVCCGHSFGGLVAQELALSYPERIRGLILAETMYGLNSTPWEAALAAWTHIWLPQIMGPKNYLKLMVSFYGMLTPGAIPYILEEAERHLADESNQRNIIRASLKFDSRWRLHRIGCPTLIMIGQLPHVPLILMQSYEMLWHIRQAKFAIIPNAGHILHWDNPKIFNKTIAGFLDEL